MVQYVKGAINEVASFNSLFMHSFNPQNQVYNGSEFLQPSYAHMKVNNGIQLYLSSVQV